MSSLHLSCPFVLSLVLSLSLYISLLFFVCLLSLSLSLYFFRSCSLPFSRRCFLQASSLSLSLSLYLSLYLGLSWSPSWLLVAPFFSSLSLSLHLVLIFLDVYLFSLMLSCAPLPSLTCRMIEWQLWNTSMFVVPGIASFKEWLDISGVTFIWRVLNLRRGWADAARGSERGKVRWDWGRLCCSCTAMMAIGHGIFTVVQRGEADVSQRCGYCINLWLNHLCPRNVSQLQDHDTLKRVTSWQERSYPPSGNITSSFFACGINFVGTTGKSVTLLPEIVTGEWIPWDYRKVWPGLSAVCSDVNWWRTRITGNIGNAITGKILGELIWSNYWKIGNRRSVITRNVWRIHLVIFSAGGGICLASHFSS